MPELDEFTVVDSDGVEIFCRRWLPSDTARAAVVLVHGASEHSGRYARVAEVLRAEGYAAYALDLRGHGRTAGSTGRGRIGPRGMDGIVDDVDALVRRARAELGHCPVVLLGHSMGSVVVQAYVAQHGDVVDGYVLSGTSGPTEGTVDFRDGLRQAIDAGLADEPFESVGDSFEPGRTSYDWLSRDDDEVDKYIADPLCGDGYPLTYGYVAGVLETIADVMEPDGIERIPIGMRVLLLAGTADPVSDGGTQVRELERRLRDAGLDVTSRYYAGARHEVLNEINRDEVHVDLLDWLATVVDTGSVSR
jgi:alpha-beta hydrolase superfamily lysophospholipase